MVDTSYKLKVAEHYAFKFNEEFIVMDVNSLDVYVIEKLDHSIMKALQNFDAANKLRKLEEQYGAQAITVKIMELLEAGILKNNMEANTAVPKDINKEELESVDRIDMLLSEDCNLACKYCFVKNGQYVGKTAYMKLEVGKKAVDFLISRSGGRKDIHICFFGGEPLLNFKLLTEMVVYADAESKKFNKQIHFTITTNGTLLNDEIIDLFQKHKIRVTISIDGDAASHNMNRPISKGGDSYAEIVKKLELLNQTNISFAARATISSLTADKIASNYEHLKTLGFKGIHFENAFGPEGEIFVNNKNDIDSVKEQYTLIANETIEKVKSGQQFDVQAIPMPLGKIVNKRPISHSCKAGRGYVTVDVHGDIYLCHRLVGVKDFLLGNVVQGTFNTRLPEIITSEMNVENRKICKRCWARHLCGGGCYAVNYEFNKDISLAPHLYCQQKKHSIKLALMIYATSA